jgi:hypothetical protein
VGYLYNNYSYKHINMHVAILYQVHIRFFFANIHLCYNLNPKYEAKGVHSCTCKMFGPSQRTIAGSGRHPKPVSAALRLWPGGAGGRRHPYATAPRRSTPLHPQARKERASGGGLLELEKKLEQGRWRGGAGRRRETVA